MCSATSTGTALICIDQINWATSGRYPSERSRQTARKQIVSTVTIVSLALQDDFRRYDRSVLNPKPLPSIDIESESTRDSAETINGKKVY